MVTDARPKGTLVAKFTERKMSANTGLDTDFVREWWLVHDETPPREAMGNPYQLYYTLTVGGEVRANDMVESAMTPTKLAETFYGGSDYENATKYGAFKTAWDRRESKRQAEQKAKETAQSKAHEAQQRYENIVGGSGTSKGVRKGTIQVYTSLEGGKSGKTPMEGLIIGRGIGIVTWGEGKYKSYSVTHMPTGMAFSSRMDRKEAIALGKTLASMGEWSDWNETKDVPASRMEQAKAAVQAFMRESITDEDLEKITGTPKVEPRGTTTIVTRYKGEQLKAIHAYYDDMEDGHLDYKRPVSNRKPRITPRMPRLR